LDDDQLVIADRWFVIDAIPEESRTYPQQVRDLATELRNLPHPTAFETIDRIFHVSCGTIYKHLEECRWTGQREGCHRITPPEKRSSLEEHLLDRFGPNNPTTYVDAWDWVDQNWQTALDMPTLRNYIRKMPALHIIKGIPMAQERVFGDPAQITLH
jgi:hypothetical protein